MAKTQDFGAAKVFYGVVAVGFAVVVAAVAVTGGQKVDFHKAAMHSASTGNKHDVPMEFRSYKPV